MAGFKFPKALGACADKLYELRAQRLEAQKVVDKIQEEENALKVHLINTLPKSEANGISGKVAKVQILTSVVPRVEDWDAFYAHVKKTGAFEMLQKRLTDTAIAERWENGKEVPGVGRFNVVKVSVTKV